MKITTLRKMKYEGRFIYVMQFDTVFQYLFAEDGDVYQNHFFYKPKWWRIALWKIGLLENLYTPSELEDGEQIILSGAMATIDKIRDPIFVKDDPVAKQKEEAQRIAGEQGENKCLWQSRQAHDGKFYWMCLRHGKAVKMTEGEAPVHD